MSRRTMIAGGAAAAVLFVALGVALLSGRGEPPAERARETGASGAGAEAKTKGPDDGPDFRIAIDVGGAADGIPSMWHGAFFEEINHAGDGGLYAELVANRSFEASDAYPDYWSVVRSGDAEGEIALHTGDLLNDKQKRALALQVDRLGDGGRVGASNVGYWGIRTEAGKTYRLSFYAKRSADYRGGLEIAIENANGTKTCASGRVEALTEHWRRYELTLQANETVFQARLTIYAEGVGTVYLDVVSLFPTETWKSRGIMRTDLAQMVAEMRPKFLRFPGGCFVEGDTPENAWDWKRTIGDIAERPGHWNLWGYYTTNGLGFHEFLQWAEDLGAEPVYVANIGISHGFPDPANQYTAVPLDELDPLIQDVLDAIEYANGPVTSKWGAVRAANGHPEPFGLKYVEIGNENNFQYSEYLARYPLFYHAIKARYPDITLIANMPVPGVPVDMVDEHYYSSPEWFIQNANKYDRYDRNGPRIYVGEYAVTSGAGRGNLHAALAEAAFITGMERNSDIVRMASYAPLFVHDRDRRWNPDAIVFNNEKSYGTPSYYVQKLFAENAGDVVLPTAVNPLNGAAAPPVTGAIGVGTWATQAEFDDVNVTSSDGKTLLSVDFSGPAADWKPSGGRWKVEDGVYRQTETGVDIRSVAGDSAWKNYTVTLRARKTGGAEGMLILFGVRDANNFYWWNLGGWNNTRHAIEKATGGVKSILGQAVPGRIETGRWYDIKVVVEGNRIRCYLDGELIHDVTDDAASGPLFATSSHDREKGLLMVKVVNVSESDQTAEIVLEGASGVAAEGEWTILTSEHLTDENSFQRPDKIVPVTRPLTGVAATFRHTFPRYSVNVLRIPVRPDGGP